VGAVGDRLHGAGAAAELTGGLDDGADDPDDLLLEGVGEGAHGAPLLLLGLLLLRLHRLLELALAQRVRLEVADGQNAVEAGEPDAEEDRQHHGERSHEGRADREGPYEGQGDAVRCD